MRGGSHGNNARECPSYHIKDTVQTHFKKTFTEAYQNDISEPRRENGVNFFQREKLAAFHTVRSWDGIRNTHSSPGNSGARGANLNSEGKLLLSQDSISNNNYLSVVLAETFSDFQEPLHRLLRGCESKQKWRKREVGSYGIPERVNLRERGKESIHGSVGGNTQEACLPWTAPGPGAVAQRAVAEGFQQEYDRRRLRAVFSGFGTEFVTGAQTT